MGGFNYPERYVRYIDVFRQRYFHYGGIVRKLGGLFPGGVAGRKLLDLGCGTGSFAIAMADAGYDVLGTDASAESIELARERAAGRPNIRFELQDFHEPRLNETFDLITVLHIPISLTEMAHTLARYREHLAPDGYAAQLYLRKAANVVRDDRVDIDRHADPAGFKLVRFNQWLLDDHRLDFLSIVLIQDGGPMRLEFDTAKMELLPPAGVLEHEHYVEVHDWPTRNNDSTPPWSEEYLQVLTHRKA